MHLKGAGDAGYWDTEKKQKKQKKTEKTEKTENTEKNNIFLYGDACMIPRSLFLARYFSMNTTMRKEHDT